MKIVIIGSGNVAYHLALAFHQNQIVIQQIFGRNLCALEAIKSLTNFPIETDINALADADIYIVAVKDDSISECTKWIQNDNALVVHTAGSVSYSVIPECFRRGVFYPLQTFSKARMLNYSEIPFFIETENPEDEEILSLLAKKISSHVMIANEDMRGHLHLAAVFACNFTNHLFTQAEEICNQKKIPFSHLHPLIFETIDKIKFVPPKQAQTGPAVRNDISIIMKQINMLNESPQKIYKTLTESIIEMYHPKENKNEL